MAAIYANNMKENAMQKDALTYLRFVNQKKKGEDLLRLYRNIALPSELLYYSAFYHHALILFFFQAFASILHK